MPPSLLPLGERRAGGRKEGWGGERVRERGRAGKGGREGWGEGEGRKIHVVVERGDNQILRRKQRTPLYRIKV